MRTRWTTAVFGAVLIAVFAAVLLMLVRDADDSGLGAGSHSAVFTSPSEDDISEPDPTSSSPNQGRQESSAVSADQAPAASRADAGRIEPPRTAFSPSRLFADYIDQAVEGDADAQYVVMTALKNCLGGIQTAAELEAMRFRGLPNEVLAAISDKFERCRALYAVVPDIEAEHERWSRSVRESRHPLILVKRPADSSAEKRQAIIFALAAKYPEEYLYAEVYVEAARYFRTFPDRIDPVKEAAWLSLYCEASFSCDNEAEHEEWRKTTYAPWQYEEIVTLEQKIRSALDQQDWDSLGL
jgi:hypothetical protein